MNWNKRYKEMRKFLNMSTEDVAEKTGNTVESVYTVTQKNARFPKWVTFAVVIFEKMHERILDLECKLHEEKGRKTNYMPLLVDVNFKELRLKKGMTLREVSNHTGISESLICQLESGKSTNPSYGITKVLFDLYNY